MPWCPFCCTEYESSVARCTDCGATLVPEPPLNVEDDESAGPEEVMRSRDRRFLENASAYLARQSIPTEVVDVPAEPGVSSGYALVTDGRSWSVAVGYLLPAVQALGQAPPNPVGLLPETLKQPLKEIIDRGEESLVDLGKGLLAGDAEMQTKCEYALVHIGESAREFLVGMLLDAIGADDSWRIQRICRPLVKFSNPETLEPVFEILDKGSHKVGAVTALGYLRDECAVPRLVQLLEDDDVSVRDEAAEALYNITGRPFEFEADDPPETRHRAVEQWTRWMQWRGMA